MSSTSILMMVKMHIFILLVCIHVTRSMFHMLILFLPTHTDTVYDELTEVCFEIDWFSLPARLILKSDQDDLPINAACYIKTAFYNNGG